MLRVEVPARTHCQVEQETSSEHDDSTQYFSESDTPSLLKPKFTATHHKIYCQNSGHSHVSRSTERVPLRYSYRQPLAPTRTSWDYMVRLQEPQPSSEQPYRLQIRDPPSSAVPPLPNFDIAPVQETLMNNLSARRKQALISSYTFYQSDKGINGSNASETADDRAIRSVHNSNIPKEMSLTDKGSITVRKTQKFSASKTSQEDVQSKRSMVTVNSKRKLSTKQPALKPVSQFKSKLDEYAVAIRDFLDTVIQDQRDSQLIASAPPQLKVNIPKLRSQLRRETAEAHASFRSPQFIKYSKSGHLAGNSIKPQTELQVQLDYNKTEQSKNARIQYRNTTINAQIKNTVDLPAQGGIVKVVPPNTPFSTAHA